MLDQFKQILTSQFEASLAMLNACVDACPEEYWEGKIASGSFRWVAYHTLLFSPNFIRRRPKTHSSFATYTSAAATIAAIKPALD